MPAGLESTALCPRGRHAPDGRRLLIVRRTGPDRGDLESAPSVRSMARPGPRRSLAVAGSSPTNVRSSGSGIASTRRRSSRLDNRPDPTVRPPVTMARSPRGGPSRMSRSSASAPDSDSVAHRVIHRLPAVDHDDDARAGSHRACAEHLLAEALHDSPQEGRVTRVDDRPDVGERRQVGECPRGAREHLDVDRGLGMTLSQTSDQGADECRSARAGSTDDAEVTLEGRLPVGDVLSLSTREVDQSEGNTFSRWRGDQVGEGVST